MSISTKTLIKTNREREVKPGNVNISSSTSHTNKNLTNGKIYILKWKTKNSISSVQFQNQIYVRVDILLTCGKHLHDLIIHQEGGFFFTMKLILYIWMFDVSMLPVSVIILFDFGIVPTICYFLFFISLYIFCHL
jgi:hypothetical protein